MDIYIQFIGAVLVLMIIPGPDMAYCIACGMSKGIKGAFFAATGIGIGGVVLTFATAFIVYFSASVSPNVFIYIQMLGATYLFYLGVKILSSKAGSDFDIPTPKYDYKNIFLRGVITNISNPKALVFFLSFLPQFVPNNSSNIVLNIFILGILLCIVGSILNFLFGVLGISLKNIAQKTFLNRSVEQYITALIFILVSLLFFGAFAQSEFYN